MLIGEPLYLSAAQALGRPGPLRLLATALFVLAVPLLAFTTGIRVLFSLPQVYDYSLVRYDAAALSGIPEPELRRANRELARYFSDDRRLFQLEVTDELGRQVPLFTPEETAHLADVKALLGRLYAVQMGALAYVLLYVVAVYIWAREGSLRDLAGACLWSAGATYAALGALAGAALTGFGPLWERLHTLLFDNDLWRLDPARHHLIQMFPQEFWFEMALLLLGGTLALMTLLGALALAYLWLSRPRRWWAEAAVSEAPQLPWGGPAVEGLRGGQPGARLSRESS